MTLLKLTTLIVAVLGAGALFGFYFTMSVSILPGLDLTEAYVAITANQDIGRATQQSWFFAALLGTPLALLLSAILHRRDRFCLLWLGLSFAGWVTMMIITLTLNVPLNQVLGGLTVTPEQPNLDIVWANYSDDWQTRNWLRVLTSGLSLVFAGLALRTSG